ncbi:MAG: GAF domain-containing protein [Desulfobacterales bacterium]|nr:GAF domain-containing protein [Desulfobacterales bacterium]
MNTLKIEERFQRIFRGVSRGSMDEIIQRLEAFTLQKDAPVYSAGEDPVGVYLIEEGRVRIYLPPLTPGQNAEDAIIKGPGDYFGEMSLLARRRRQGAAVSLDRVRGWLLKKEDFFRMAMAEPVFALNLARNVVNYTREADGQLIQKLVKAKKEAERSIDRLKGLSKTSQAINSTLELDNLLSIILREATLSTLAEKGTIYLLDEDAEEMVSRVLRGSYIEEIRLPLGKGLAGHVAATGNTLNIADAYTDSRFNPDIDRITGYRSRAILSTPMHDPDQKIVGVIQLLNKSGGGPFTDEDEAFVLALGVHASIAIRNAQMAEKMIRNESLSAVGNLAARIIHDIKSPMTVIRGYAQILSALHPEAKEQEYVQAIESQIDRLVDMTQEVLDFARGKIDLRYSNESLSGFFGALALSLKEDLLQRDIELIVTLPRDDVTAIFDRSRITRVFYNLVNNAREAMPEGGLLEIDVYVNGDSWVLKIADTGVGIQLGNLQRIFEPFASYGKTLGTGLGLAITSKVVEQHSGRIGVESKEGEGTTFTLTMPQIPTM